MQVSNRRATPLASLLCDLVKAESFLGLSVEIGVMGEAGFHACFDKDLRKRIGRTLVGDIQRAARTVIFRRPALLILGLLEVWKNVRESPSRIAQTAPLIVILVVATDVDHG